jgi:hypothetical protein
MEPCSICLDDLNPTTDYAITPCKHSFHFTCISKVNTGGCPLCRAELEKNKDNNKDYNWLYAIFKGVQFTLVIYDAPSQYWMRTLVCFSIGVELIWAERVKRRTWVINVFFAVINSCSFFMLLLYLKNII